MTLPMTMPSPVSPAQAEAFEREGWLVIEDLFEARELQAVIDEVHAEVNRLAEAEVAAGRLSRTYAEAGFERQLARISRETQCVVGAIGDGKLCGPAIFDLIRHPKLLAVARQFCGDELIASSVYRLRPKIPSHRRGEVPWHQDSGYLEAYCDRFMVLTFWLPLVDATEENGCLWVIPRCHKGPILKHAFPPEGKTYLEILPEDLPAERKPVCVPMRKGSVLVLTNLTPHASFENRTDGVRWSMDLRYQSAALPTNAPITRLPDEPSDPDAPIACYPPEADFLVHSLRRPGEVVCDPEAFRRMRQEHLRRPSPTRKRWAPL